MKLKKIALTALLASSLLVSAGTILAQDETTPPDTQAQQNYRGPRGMQEGRGPRERFGPHVRARIDFRLDMLGYAEEYTGLTVTELREAHQNGQTLADLIVANGQSIDDFIAVVVGDVNGRIDEAVANGRITAERAEQMKATVLERLTARLNGEAPQGPPVTDASGI
jgi:hypothetical protein